MRFAFLGTPEFAKIILQKLIENGFLPSILICNPDRPAGRKQILTPPPTKLVALKHNIPIWQPERLDIETWKSQINKVGGVDLAIVAAYAKIIPKVILNTLPNKFIGVHPSLLPRHRGATPIQTAILQGGKITGVTIFLMDEKVDHGPIIASKTLEIQNKNYETLNRELAELGGKILIEILPKFAKGECVPLPQNEKEATYTKKFSTEDAYVDLERNEATLIERKTRALNPEPGVWTFWPGGKPFEQARGKRVKILEVKIKDGKLILKKVQLEGKKPQNL